MALLINDKVNDSDAHCCHRCFKKGITLETIQMMNGHSKIATTQIYTHVAVEKIIDDMSGLEDQLNVKRAIILNNAATTFLYQMIT